MGSQEAKPLLPARRLSQQGPEPSKLSSWEHSRSRTHEGGTKIFLPAQISHISGAVVISPLSPWVVVGMDFAFLGADDPGCLVVLSQTH